MGDIAPHDHPEMAGDNSVIRRICADHVVPDENRGGSRLSSALFKNDPREGSYLSVDSVHCITEAGNNPAEFVTTPKWFAALIITIASLRASDKATKVGDRWKIGMVPLPNNDCHGAVWGKITKGQSNELQRKSDWLVPAPGVAKLTA